MAGILLFGGTEEGHRLAEELCRRGAQVTVSVATSYGRELLRDVPCTRILAGRLCEEEMITLLGETDFFCVIDATHPYAVEVSRRIQNACQKTETPCLRLLREDVEMPGSLEVATASEAARHLEETQGNILLTTGTKELPAFAKIPRQRLYLRALPSAEALASAREANLEPSHLFLMQGPFSTELNAAVMKSWDIRILVTKRSGKAGGFPEKMEAARQIGAQTVVIGRPSRERGLSWDELMAVLVERKWIGEEAR